MPEDFKNLTHQEAEQMSETRERKTYDEPPRGPERTNQISEPAQRLLVDVQRLGIELVELHKDKARLEEEKAELEHQLYAYRVENRELKDRLGEVE